jgi:hypothetical protein
MSELADKITISESNFSTATKNDYNFRLSQFYKLSPIKSDDELIDCPTDELQKILVSYTRHLIKRVNNNDLSANTVPKMFRGIKWLLNSNYRENDIKWKPLEALFPKEVKRSGFKAWTTEQIALMIEYTPYLRNKALIHFQASTGARIGVHDHPLLMKHLTMMEWNGHGCYAILLYADSDETIGSSKNCSCGISVKYNAHNENPTSNTPNAKNAIMTYLGDPRIIRMSMGCPI